MEFIPKVVQAISGEGYIVYTYFDDGTVRLFDASSLIEKGDMFAPIRDIQIFRDSLTVMNDTVAWDIGGNRDECNCIDVDPVTLYETCSIVEDPLEEHDENRRMTKLNLFSL